MRCRRIEPTLINPIKPSKLLKPLHGISEKDHLKDQISISNKGRKYFEIDTVLKEAYRGDYPKDLIWFNEDEICFDKQIPFDVVNFVAKRFSKDSQSHDAKCDVVSLKSNAFNHWGIILSNRV
jgi:ribosome biogenesis GTPase A